MPRPEEGRRCVPSAAAEARHRTCADQGEKSAYNATSKRRRPPWRSRGPEPGLRSSGGRPVGGEPGMAVPLASGRRCADQAGTVGTVGPVPESGTQSLRTLKICDSPPTLVNSIIVPMVGHSDSGFWQSPEVVGPAP